MIGHGQSQGPKQRRRSNPSLSWSIKQRHFKPQTKSCATCPISWVVRWRGVGSTKPRLVCCETWGYCSDIVISQSTALPADADDVTDLMNTQWRVLAISDKGRILNGLHAPHNLMMKMQTPTATAKDTGPIRAAKTDALPSMLRKRWGGDAAPLPSEKPSRIVPMLNTSRRSAHPNHSHRDGAKS